MTESWMRHVCINMFVVYVYVYMHVCVCACVCVCARVCMCSLWLLSSTGARTTCTTICNMRTYTIEYGQIAACLAVRELPNGLHTPW